jgi:hypothetical protein
MLPGEGRWPMPCALAKGLLPGRGPAGRWPMPCALAKGLLPGRGAPPGRGGWGADPPGRGAAAPGVAASVAAGADSAGAGAAGAVGAAGRVSGVAGAAGAAAAGAGAAGAGAAGRAGPGRPGRGACAAGACSAGLAVPSAWRAARSFRATGGSMVEEGLLTNSPSSFSFARATLLSTPSSEAISCTRGFATILLSGAYPKTGQTVSRGRVSFRAVHFVSIAIQPFLDGLRVKRC